MIPTTPVSCITDISYYKYSPSLSVFIVHDKPPNCQHATTFWTALYSQSSRQCLIKWFRFHHLPNCHGKIYYHASTLSTSNTVTCVNFQLILALFTWTSTLLKSQNYANLRARSWSDNPWLIIDHPSCSEAIWLRCLPWNTGVQISSPS